MTSALPVVEEELRRLRHNGVDRVFVGDEALATLRALSTSSEGSAHSVPPSTSQQKQYHDLKGLISEEKPKQAEPVEGVGSSKTTDTTDLPPPPTAPIHLEGHTPKAQIEALENRVRNCPTCRANLDGQDQIVFGSGDCSADIFFCGDAPGRDEAATGEPFTEEAGELLDKILSAMGLDRQKVYLTNVVKWRPRHTKPYGNRPPRPDEMRFCLPYLKAQIDIVQPKVIIALGNTAVSGLLGPDPERKLASIRGQWRAFHGRPMMITFHPSYLLRNGTLKTKRLLWEDLLQIMEYCNLPISEQQRNFFLPRS